MAVVLRHVHTCPRCEQDWECLSWTCDCEIEEMPCTLCRSNEDHKNADTALVNRDSLPERHILARCVLMVRGLMTH